MTTEEKLEKLKKLADAMYYAAQYLTTDASRLRKTMEDYHQFIINEYHREEPVSKDLEEAAIQFATDTETGKVDVVKQSSFFWGAIYHKQQLMKNVVLETEVLRDSDGDGVDTPYESWLTLANTEIPDLPESLGLKEGDKVKVIIIKKD